MFSFSRLSGCVLSVALTSGLAVDVLASELTRERAASALYGKTPAQQRMMLSERAAVTAAPPWFRMPPPAVTQMRVRAPRQPAALARFQRPVPAPAFNHRPATRHTAARIAQYRQPMPPPAPMWARAPRQPAALAHFQRPLPAPARIAQYRQPMPPMWARAPRQLMASPSSSPADTQNLQAHKGDGQNMGQASETAELAAFESSPSDISRLQIQNGDSDDIGQASEIHTVEEPVAEVPPLLARPTLPRT